MIDHVGDISSRREPLIKQFSQENLKTVRHLEGLINRNILHVMKLVLEAPKIKDSWYGLECLKLLDHAIKTSISCTDLFKQLRFLEAAILSRHIIELCAAAIAIRKDESYLAEFLIEKKFDPMKSIGIAKKEIPEIGKLFGLISNHLVHVNPYSHGTTKTVEGEEISIKLSLTLFDVGLPQEEHKEMYVAYIELIHYLIQTAIEIIYFEKGEFRGFPVFLHPNEKHFVFGDEGYPNFSKRFERLFKEPDNDDSNSQ